jgi:hypothetical protein
MDTEHAYTAGLVDGEGTVGYSRLHAGRNRVPVVSVPSCTRSLLVPLQEIYGGSLSTKRTYKKGHSPSWVWAVQYDAALAFLTLILPFMREPEKIRRTKLLIKYHKNLTPRNGRYTPRQKRLKADFETRFFKNTRRRLALTLQD